MVPAGAGDLLIVGSFKKRVPDPDFKVNFKVIRVAYPHVYLPALHHSPKFETTMLHFV